MRRLRRIFVGFLALVGLICVLVGGGLAIIGWYLWDDFAEAREPRDGTVLTLSLDGGVRESGPDFPLPAALFPSSPALPDIVMRLDRAASDPRVTGVLVDLGRAELGLAQAQELRAAIAAFRAAGKRATAFADSFSGPGATRSYYLASAFDAVWLQPTGDLELLGFELSSPFLGGALDEIGIDAQIGQREAFKSFGDMITARSMPWPVQQMFLRLAEGLLGQVVAGVAEGRSLGREAVRTLVDRSPLSATEALEARLVDRLGYADDAREAAGAVGGQALALDDYAPPASGPVVALIALEGQIERGSDGPSPLDGSAAATGDRIAEAIADAAADDDVVGILLRVNSPGGSYVASDTIRHAVSRARASGTPVVVSMSDLAASGGYFVAIAGDRLLAQAGTLTGSIGVVAGKLVARRLAEELEIGWGSVKAGANADFWSPMQPFDSAQRAHLDRTLDRIYADFKTQVAEARRLPGDSVNTFAGGRVWTGAEAVTHGLVDAVGGFPEALDALRELAGLAGDSPIDLVPWPKQMPWDRLAEIAYSLRASFAGDPGALADLPARVIAGLRPFTRSEPLLLAPLGTGH